MFASIGARSIRGMRWRLSSDVAGQRKCDGWNRVEGTVRDGVLDRGGDAVRVVRWTVAGMQCECGAVGPWWGMISERIACSTKRVSINPSVQSSQQENSTADAVW